MTSGALSLMPIQVKLIVPRDSTRRIRLTFTANDDAPQDLTGSTIKFTVKASRSTSAAVVYATTASLTDPPASPTDGLAVLTIPKASTFGPASVEGFYYYEIRLIESNGDETPWWSGELVTKPTPSPL